MLRAGMLETKRAKLMLTLVTTLLLALFAMSLQASPALAADPTLTVTKTGTGTVTSDPPGINCGTDCSEPYPSSEVEICNQHGVCTTQTVYQEVNLSASVISGSGWAFGSWSGACTGTSSTCSVLMNADKTVNATFVDIQNPTVSLTSPTGPYASGTINLSATASDNHQLARVEFRVNGSLVGTDTTDPYSLSYNTTSVPDGSKEFRATAVDVSGRTADHARLVTVDNTPPVLNINSGPEDGQTFAGGTTQTWNFTASDGTGSGIQEVRCSVVSAGSTPSYGPCSGGSSHSVSGRSEGSHTFYVKAKDFSGRETIETRDFSIDATAPTVTTWLPKGKKVSPKAKPTVTFSEAMNEATVEASASGKPTTFVLKKGSTVIPASVTYTESGTTFKAILTPTKPLKRGAKYTATVTTAAKDEVGNALVAKTWSFTVKP